MEFDGSVPLDREQKLFFYDGSNNLRYVCTADQDQDPTSSVKRSDSTLTSIVVLTNVGTATTSTAHGLYVGARVTITGATVDADLNGTFTLLTVPSTTTYTFATVAVADATYNEATLVVTTRYPLTTNPLWAIQVFTYDASNNLTGSFWANSNLAKILLATDRSKF